MSYKIISKFIKDISFEIPTAQAFVMLEKEIANYSLNFDIKSKPFKNNIIEIAPIAFMRGRTLEDCYIILDEAQNTTKIQMKMFLTRLGKNSKMVIVGDNTQIDLISKNESGLIDASKKLKNINDIGFVELDQRDVIRHEVVRKIINAYEDKNKN